MGRILFAWVKRQQPSLPAWWWRGLGGSAVPMVTLGSHQEAAEISVLPSSSAFLFKVLKNNFD